MNHVNKIVWLESGAEYDVTADYMLEYNAVSQSVECSLVIHAIKPINRLRTALTQEIINEIESALAYKIIDEYNDNDTDEDFEGYPC